VIRPTLNACVVFVAARTATDPLPAGGIGIVLLTISHAESLAAVHVHVIVGAETVIVQFASGAPA